MNIEINEQSLKELKNKYEEAVASGAEQFVFQGADLLTAYAKYLIEYVEAQLCA